MYFDSFQAILAMDGHGPFVWAAYSITIVVLALMLSMPLRRERRLRREIAGVCKRNQAAPGGISEVTDAPGT
jgi:heme exporter protein D